MNLIYACVFHQQSYIKLLKLLITSISEKANICKETTDILIITSTEFESLIRAELQYFDLPLHYYNLDIHSLFDAGCARLNIFKYEHINKYNKILYLDTDILLNSDINVLFDAEISSDKLYALEESHIGHEYNYWGSAFFDFTKYDRNTTAFSSGVLLFVNSDCMKSLFDIIQSHIQDYIYIKQNAIPICLDQPFIVYNAIVQNKYDNQLLKSYVENNPTDISSKKIVYHFPGGPGVCGPKITLMTDFWRKIKKGSDKIKICQHGTDGAGHQLEGMLRLISLSLNDRAEYKYDFKKTFEFQHSNFDKRNLEAYFLRALDILSGNSNKDITTTEYKVVYNEQRTFKEIINNDEYSNTIYCYDGIGCGNRLPPNFEDIEDLKYSLPALRDAFVLKNQFLPKPSYDTRCNNIVCHIRLGDAIGTRCLDTDAICNFIKKKQAETADRITIHSNGNIDFLKADNTILYGCDTDVLQILSDFIHADILIINYSALSIAAHLLASDAQKVFCPNVAGPTFYKRILSKCVKISSVESGCVNKRYSWQNDSILFLENGQMEAFGLGTYTQQDLYTFIAQFGGRMHSIVFNKDYSEFTSTRQDDNHIVKGNIM